MKYKIASASIFATCTFLAPAAHAQDAPLAIHGFGIIYVQNDYITPRGLFVTNKGVTVQVITGLVFGLYREPMAAIDGVSLVVGTFNDIDSSQHHPTAGAWNEFDWIAGPSIHFQKDWTLD